MFQVFGCENCGAFATCAQTKPRTVTGPNDEDMLDEDGEVVGGTFGGNFLCRACGLFVLQALLDAMAILKVEESQRILHEQAELN